MKNFFATFILLLSFYGGTSNAADVDTRNSFAVIWQVNTTDKELFKNSLAEQSSDLLSLWQKGIIENVYLDRSKNQGITLGDKGKVMFFIKAETEAAARKTLDEMTFIKKKVATYELHKVGILWLKQF